MSTGTSSTRARSSRSVSTAPVTMAAGGSFPFAAKSSRIDTPLRARQVSGRRSGSRRRWDLRRLPARRDQTPPPRQHPGHAIAHRRVVIHDDHPEPRKQVAEIPRAHLVRVPGGGSAETKPSTRKADPRPGVDLRPTVRPAGRRAAGQWRVPGPNLRSLPVLRAEGGRTRRRSAAGPQRRFRAGVVDLDGNGPPPAAATDQDPCIGSVFDGVGHQVLNDGVDKPRIAMDPG